MSAHTDATAGQEPSNAELLLDFGASDPQQSNGPTNGNHINGNFSQFNETNGHGAFDPLGDFGGHTNPFAEDTNPFQCKEATPPKHSDIDIFKSQFDPPPQEPKQAWPGEGQDPFAAHEFDKESSPASFREKSPEPASLHDLEAEPHSDMMEPSAKELSPNPFLKEASPEPSNDKSPEPFADDFSRNPFQKELSPAPDLTEPSPEPFMKEASPGPFMKEASPEPLMKERSPEPFAKELSPEPFAKEATPELREPSPDPFMKEASPEPFMKEKSPEPFIREPSPEPFMKEASPQPFEKEASPQPFEKEASPQPFEKEASPQPFEKEASPQPFEKEASPQPFEKEASPQPFEKEASPQPFGHESSPEPFMKEPSPQPEAFREPSPEPFIKEPTPEVVEASPEPFMKESSPAPFQKEASPEPFVKEATPELKESTPEPSPEPFMKESSPEPFMKEPSPEPFMKEPSPEPFMREPTPESFMKEASPEPFQKEASPEPFVKEATPEPFAPGATEIDFEKSPSPFAEEATQDSLKEPSPEPFMKEISPEPSQKEGSPEPFMKEPTPEPKEASPAPLTEPIPEPAVEETTPEPLVPVVPVAPVAAVKKAPSPTKQKSLSPTKEKSPKAPTPTKTAPKSAKPEVKKAATPTKAPASKSALAKTAPAKPPTTKPAVPKTTATKPAVPKTAPAPKAPAPKPAVPKAAPAKPKEAPKAPATAKPAPKPAVPKAPRSVKSDVKPPPAKDPAKPETRKSSASPSRIATRKTEVSKSSSSSTTKTTTTATSVKKAPAAKPSSAPPSRTRTAAAKSATPERKTPDRTAKSTDSKPEWDWTISNPQKEKKLPPAPRQAKSADIESRKLEWKVESKVGSLDNATHKPGGGAKKRRRGVDLEYLESLGDGTAAFYAAILDDSNLTLVGKLGQHGADFGSALEGSTIIVTGHVKDLNESSDDVIDASKMADLLGLTVESGELKIDGPGTDVKSKLEKAKIRLSGTSSLTKRKEADLNGAVVVILNDDDIERPLLLEKAKMTILDSENKPTDVKDFGFIFDGVPIEFESTVGGDNGDDGCKLQDSKLKIQCANPCAVIRKSEFEVSGKANAKKKTAAYDSGMHGAGMTIMGNVGEKTTTEKIEWSENSVKIPVKDANLKMRLKGEKAEKFTIDDSFGNGFVRIDAKDKKDEIVDFLGGQNVEITGTGKVTKKGTEGTGMKVQLTSGETKNEVNLDNAILKFSGVDDKVLDGADFVISGSLPEAKSAADILKDQKITLVGIATVAKDDSSMATEMEDVEVRIEGTVKDSEKETLASKKEDPNGISLRMKNSKLELDVDPSEMHNSKITVTGKTHGDGAKSKIDGAQIFVTDRTGKKTRNMALEGATISLKNADGQEVDTSKLGKVFNGSEIRLAGKLDANEEANLKDSEIWITGAKGVDEAVKGGVITLEGKAKVPKSSAAYQAGLNDTTVRIQAVAKGSDAKLPEGSDSAYSSLLSKGEIEIKTAYDPEPKVVEFEQARIEVLGKPNDELFGYLSGAKFDIKGEAKPTKTACDLKNANCKIEGDSDFVLSDARLSLDEEKSRDDLNRLMGGATVRISGQTPEMKDTAAILDGAKVTLKGKAKVTGDKAKLAGDLDGKKVVIKGGLKFLVEADNDVECGAKDANRVGMTFSDMEIELEGAKDAADLEGSGLTLTGHPELEGEKCVLKDGEILVKKGRKINRFSLEGAEVEIHDENTGDKKPVTDFEKIFNGSNLVVSGKMAGPHDSGKGSMRDVTGSISGARRPEVLLTQGKNLVISGKVSCKKGSPAHDAGMNGTAISITGSTDPNKTLDVSGNTVTVENSKLAINTGYSDMDRLLGGVVIGMDEKVDPDFLNGVDLDFEGNGDSLKVTVKSSTGSDSEFVIEKLNVTLEDGTKLDNDDLKRMLQDAKLKMSGKTIKKDRPADVLKNKDVTVSGTVNCSDAKAKDLNGKPITITTKLAGKVEDYIAPKEKSKSASIGGSLDNATLGFEGDGDLSGAEVEIVGKVHLGDDDEYTLDGGNIIVANHGGKHAKKVAMEGVKIDVGDAKKNFGYFEGTDMKLSGKMGSDGKFEATSMKFENLKTDSEKFAFITDHTMEISGVCKALPGCTDKVESLKGKKLIVRGRCDENKTGPEDMEFNPNRVEVKDAKIGMAGQDGTKFDCDLHEGEFEVEDDPELANFFNGAKLKVKKEKNFVVSIDKGEEKGDLSFRTASVWFEGTDPDKMLRLFMSSIFTLDGRLVATPFDADGNYRVSDLDGAEIDISGKATGGEGHSDLSGTKLKIINKNGSGKTIDGDFVDAAIIVEDCEGDEFKGAVNIKGKVVNTDDGVGIKNGKVSLKGSNKAGSKIHINGKVANCKDPDMNGVELTISGTIGPNGELENAVVRGGSAQGPDQEFLEAASKNKAKVRAKSGAAQSEASEIADEDLPDDAFEVDEHGNFLLDEHGRRIRKSIFGEKLNWDADKKVDTWNPAYKPSQVEKKTMFHEDLEWKAQKKLDTFNKDYKPGGGNKKVVVNHKLKWEGKSRLNTGMSKPAAKKEGNGDGKKIVDDKVQVKAESKVGSLDNAQHKAGGGDKK